MAKIRTLSRTFLKGHPRAGEPTNFPQKLIECITLIGGDDGFHAGYEQFVAPYKFDCYPIKGHTIRMGRHFKPQDELTLAVWSDKPYQSKQIKLWTGPIRAIDIDFYSSNSGLIWVANVATGKKIDIPTLAKNDGLYEDDFKIWFTEKSKVSKVGEAQILIWNPQINY